MAAWPARCRPASGPRMPLQCCGTATGAAHLRLDASALRAMWRQPVRRRSGNHEGQPARFVGRPGSPAARPAAALAGGPAASDPRCRRRLSNCARRHPSAGRLPRGARVYCAGDRAVCRNPSGHPGWRNADRQRVEETCPLGAHLAGLHLSRWQLGGHANEAKLANVCSTISAVSPMTRRTIESRTRASGRQ